MFRRIGLVNDHEGGMSTVHLLLTMGAICIVTAGLYAAFIYAPNAQDFVAPRAQRIFYFHVASAWVSYLAFGVVLAMSIMVLAGRKGALAHEIAGASAEIGIVFCTAAILMGMTWGNQEWGTPWRWQDTKLTMTFVLWLVYIAYLTTKGGFTDTRGQKRMALYGILGFICVPLSFIASRIWYTFHPVIVETQGGLTPSMGMAMGIAVVALSLVYFVLLSIRVEVIKLNWEIDDLKRRIEGVDD